ncbi:unnamed protein product, partial [Sphacelaria rigidula]
DDPDDHPSKDELVKMDPKVGKALVKWSDSLRAAGRPMAACLALQAIVLGVLNASRQTSLLRSLLGHQRSSSSSPSSTPFLAGNDSACGEQERGGGGAKPAGMVVTGLTVGGIDDDVDCETYGTIELLIREVEEATDGLITLSEWWIQSLTDNPKYNLRTFLDGIPWFTPLNVCGLYAWKPPVEVAEALDAGLEDGWPSRSPTKWMSAFGLSLPEEEGGVEKRGSDEISLLSSWLTSEPAQHPCFEQFVSYMAYRDDVDLSAALHREGYTNSAWLVIGRIVASAAALLELDEVRTDRQRKRDMAFKTTAAEHNPAAAADRWRHDRKKLFAKAAKLAG